MARDRIPIPTALYRLYDAEDVLVYVGVSYQPKYRLRQHKQKKPWWAEVARVEVHWHPDRWAAEEAEREFIKAEAPRYNTVLHPVNGPAWAARITESRRRTEALKAAQQEDRDSA